MRTRIAGELTAALRELDVQIRKRYTGLVLNSPVPIEEPGPTLFAKAAQEAAAAANLAERELFEESLEPQQRSLAALTALEHLLLENAKKSKSSQGESQDDSQNNGQGEQEQQKRAPQDDPRQQRQQLQKALEQLHEIQPNYHHPHYIYVLVLHNLETKILI